MVEVFNSVDKNFEGIWRYLLHHSPKPEHLEIEKLIGIQLINSTKVLWDELKNLKDIIYQSSDDRIININADNTLNEEDNQLNDNMRKLKLTSKKTINKAIHFSQLCYNDDNDDERILNNHPIFISLYNINKFTLDIIMIKLNDIREAFMIEKEYIESEIERLILYLDDDINNKLNIHSINQSLSTKCSISTNSNTSIESIFKTNDNSKQITYSDSNITCSICKLPCKRKDKSNDIKYHNNICINCQSKKKKITSSSTTLIKDDVFENSKFLKTSQSIDNIVIKSNKNEINPINNPHLYTTNHNKSNNNDESPNNSSCGTSNNGDSKFRKRLNSARTELHFLDEF